MTAVYRTTRRVEFRDTDAAGIAHFSAFFVYMEQVEHEFLRSLGLSVVLADAGGTISWPRVWAQCDYSGAVHFEDVMDVELRLERLGEKSVTYECAFFHQGRAVARGSMTSVCCRIAAGRRPESVAIPAEFRRRLAAASVVPPESA